MSETGVVRSRVQNPSWFWTRLRTTGRAVAVVAGAVVLLAACGGDDGDDGAVPADAASAEDVPLDTGEPPVFEGDPASEFCRRSRESAERPVLDPFAPGLDAREVELRFRALAQRFGEFAEVAPEPLADDLELLDERFGELSELLESADYDFARLAEQGADVSAFDDPAFEAVAERLAAYQEQVCDREVAAG